MEETTVARAIVSAILKELQGRRGFDSWWYECDEDVQQDIRATIAKRIDKLLGTHKP